jgi:AcrR family transcriptional regulator
MYIYGVAKRTRGQKTRERIAAAVYELHRTVGPAETTITAIAEKAGVQRFTVYRNFPDEVSLYQACLEHWTRLHPWPDPKRWRGIRDPAERLRIALRDVYLFYRDVEPLFAFGLADLPRLPALAEADAPLFDHWRELRRTLGRGWGVRGRRRARVVAAIALAVDFGAWHTLVRTQGLRDEEVIELMLGAVRAAATSRAASPGAARAAVSR